MTIAAARRAPENQSIERFGVIDGDRLQHAPAERQPERTHGLGPLELAEESEQIVGVRLHRRRLVDDLRRADAAMIVRQDVEVIGETAHLMQPRRLHAAQSVDQTTFGPVGGPKRL
jgi:hypothetical protein